MPLSVESEMNTLQLGAPCNGDSTVTLLLCSWPEAAEVSAKGGLSFYLSANAVFLPLSLLGWGLGAIIEALFGTACGFIFGMAATC